MNWFWWWLLFVILLFFLPLGYGIGYRGRRVPYPAWHRRGRLERPATPAEYEEPSWGALGVVVWLVAVAWLVVALLS